MGASLAVELHKTARRPAAWVIGLNFVALVALFGYLLSYVFIVGAGGEPPPEAEQFLPTLYPENFLFQVLGLFSGFGVALTLVLGALAVGSEYGWETFKLVLTQKPDRLPYFSGKLLSLAVVIALFTLVSFAVGAVCSYVVATLQDGAVEWPAFGEIAGALGAGWLILATFAAMGLFLATLFRGTALAIGLGLVYLLVLENLFLGFATQSDAVETIGRALPGRNSVDLVTSFSGTQPGAAAGATPPGIEAVASGQASLVLGAYVVVFVGLSVVLFRSRDVVLRWFAITLLTEEFQGR